MPTTAPPQTALPPDWAATLTRIELQIETCLASVREREDALPAERQSGSLAQVNERIERFEQRLRELGELAKRSSSANIDIDAQLERGEESMRAWLSALDAVQKSVAAAARKNTALDLHSMPHA
jgi:hypothetical protein